MAKKKYGEPATVAKHVAHPHVIGMVIWVKRRYCCHVRHATTIIRVLALVPNLSPCTVRTSRQRLCNQRVVYRTFDHIINHAYIYKQDLDQKIHQNNTSLCIPSFELFFEKLIFSIIRQMSHTHPLTHSKRNVQLCRPCLRCLWIYLDVLYGFATQTLISRPFLMVRGVKIPSIGANWFLEF